jgi:hypothetical protein
MTCSVGIERIELGPGCTVQRARPAKKRRIRIHRSLTYSWPGPIGVILFLSVACTFYLSPIHSSGDAAFSLLMDEALIHNWTPDMIDYRVPRGHGGGFVNDGYPYQIKIIKGRLLYVYPWGSSMLSLPAVLLFNAFGFKIAPHRSGYQYSWDNELRMQTIIATGICALTIWVIYQTASYFLPLWWALAVALGAALGTPIWSSASRFLGGQTWSILLITIAIWILLTGSIRPFLLGTTLAWSCLARPQVIPQVAAITVYVLVRYDLRYFLRYIAGGLCWAIPVCAMMWFFTGGVFSAYYSLGMLTFPQDFWRRLYGLLLSPSRGLLIFSPIFLVPAFLTFWYRKNLPERRLAVLALVIIGMHLALLSSFGMWWGGWSYGPRLMLETVPWFVLLAILGVSSFVEDAENFWNQDVPRRPYSPVTGRAIMTGAAILLLAVSVITNAPGALSVAASEWNASPNIDTHHERLWDWKHPQFLAWMQRGN